MRPEIIAFASICARHLPFPEPIYEFGSLQVPGQEHAADMRRFFPGRKYVGADMREGRGVDVIMNLHQIDLPAGSVGSLILLETIEHVEYPRKALDEIYRVLKPGGMLIMSSQMQFPIHDYPHDYWRFTPEAFKSLLQPFSPVIVDSAGETYFPHTVVGIGFKGGVEESSLLDFRARLEEWKQYWTAASRPKGFKRFLKYLSRQDDKIRLAIRKWKRNP